MSGPVPLGDLGSSHFTARWAGLRPPLRPDAAVVAAVAAAIAGHDREVLLLGVTPELSGLGRRLTAVDNDAATISVLWRGDDSTRHVMHADWRDGPRLPAPVSAVVGDGSFTALAWPGEYRDVLRWLGEVLEPGGVLAVRVFAAPATAEAPEAVRDAALSGGLTFHAFKWRLAMAAAAADGNVAMGAIHASFERLFPDRDLLSARSRWPLTTIAEIDAYARKQCGLSFPTRAQWSALDPAGFEPARFVEAGDYPLAERCPLLVLRRTA